MALLRSAATVGGYTMASRVLGFIRDILTAAFLGAGPVADAFFVAQRLPNLFRSLFAEGAFSAAFVPLFAGTIAQDGKSVAKRFAEDSLSVLLTVLFLFVVLGEIFTPNLLDILAPGFRSQGDKFALTVGLTRITFPYLLFISLTALQGGILNSVERFAATAATPMLLNIFLIGALVLVRPISGQALAWALSASGFAQFLWLMFSCHQAGLGLSLPRPRLTPEVKRMLKLMLPGVFGAGVTQLNLVVSTAVASLLPTGPFPIFTMRTGWISSRWLWSGSRSARRSCPRSRARCAWATMTAPSTPRIAASSWRCSSPCLLPSGLVSRPGRS